MQLKSYQQRKTQILTYSLLNSIRNKKLTGELTLLFLKLSSEIEREARTFLEANITPTPNQRRTQRRRRRTGGRLHRVTADTSRGMSPGRGSVITGNLDRVLQGRLLREAFGPGTKWPDLAAGRESLQ